MSTIIHIDAAQPLRVLDEHGWTQGTYGDNGGAVCLHGAIRLCQPTPGDAAIIERVAKRQGWGIGWNDDMRTTEDMVRDRLALGVDITDVDLAETFGPHWLAVVGLVRRCAVLTAGEAERLRAALGAAQDAAQDAARGAARGAAQGAAQGADRDAAQGAAQGAARGAARGAAWGAAWDAARDAAWDAASAVVTYHLATQNGPYTYAQRDLLLAPWVTVIGPIEGLVTA